MFFFFYSAFSLSCIFLLHFEAEISLQHHKRKIKLRRQIGTEEEITDILFDRGANQVTKEDVLLVPPYLWPSSHLHVHAPLRRLLLLWHKLLKL